ncbi:creatininase family protein [bacterium]|nr:creatininase family protein [bacterium]
MDERRLDAMTWEEVRDLPPERTVAILPAGATEAHGPHLPLSTDVVIAEAMADAGARLLVERGTLAVVLPPLAYTAAPFAAAFPGTVSVRPETLTALLTDIAASLAAQGFRALAIANSHLDPEHLGSLHAAAKAAAATLPVAFPDLTGKPWATRLGDEFRTGACHAGRYETSVVMAARPGHVRDGLRRDLDANPASLSRAIQDGKRTFAEAGGPRAYFGWPADASTAEGKMLIATLGGILAEAVEALP